MAQRVKMRQVEGVKPSTEHVVFRQPSRPVGEQQRPSGCRPPAVVRAKRGSRFLAGESQLRHPGSPPAVARGHQRAEAHGEPREAATLMVVMVAVLHRRPPHRGRLRPPASAALRRHGDLLPPAATKELHQAGSRPPRLLIPVTGSVAAKDRRENGGPPGSNSDTGGGAG